MRWEDGRRSAHVEDLRGSKSPGRRRSAAVGGLGTVIIVLVGLALGVDPSTLLKATQNMPSAQRREQNEGSTPRPAAENKLADFTSVVLADTEDTWRMLMKKKGKVYEPPKLVLFTGSVDSACGYNTAAVGPFYCPADRKVYIDLQFYKDLQERFGAPGDFAQAYVIAHEVGHHLQTFLGISKKVYAKKRGLSKIEANKLSVRQELQADCFAGIWAHHANKARDMLEQGDIKEGLAAASAIGDDTLQRRAHARVSPESFTHGSSAQRVRWFKTGFAHGSLEKCDTFGAVSL